MRQYDRRVEAAMLRSNALAVLMGLLVVAVFAAAGAAPAAAADLAGGPILNVGHRGSTGLAPEHTIASYDLALEDGADYIEQDLRMTSDGVLVVLHDEDLDRTTRGPAENCTGPVSEKTLAQIKTCDVGSFFNERYPEYARDEYEGLKIPTLEEVFRRYGTETNYYIETRSSEAPPGNPGVDDSSRMEEELLKLMDEYGLREPAAENWRVLIQSFVPASLSEIHAQDPSLPLVQLYSDEETKETIRADLQAAGSYAIGVGPSMDDVDRDLVESAHARCLAVHPYTLAEKPDMRDLVGLGVDGMFTDFANRLEAVLGEEAVDGNLAAGEAADASRTCRSGAPIPDTGGISLLLPASFGALLLSLGLLVAVLRRV
jgi:glycerophosphoryl diester phosphodiesterase